MLAGSSRALSLSRAGTMLKVHLQARLCKSLALPASIAAAASPATAAGALEDIAASRRGFSLVLLPSLICSHSPVSSSLDPFVVSQLGFLVDALPENLVVSAARCN